MATQASLEEIEIAELTQTVDDARVAADPFKLLASLRTALDAALADVKLKDSSTLQSSEGQALAAFNLRTALDQLKTLLRDGFNYVKGLGSYQITDGERLAVLTAYGWESGEIGVFTDARVESLANEASAASPTIANPAHRYPPALLTLIAGQLAIINANQPTATGRAGQAATASRNAALDLLTILNSRVRFFYCAASNDLDQTSELANIGRQPRRDAGDAAAAPKPGPNLTATFDATALTLTLPALPDHATTLRAIRRSAGGVAEVRGTSTTTTVSVIDLSPLPPGVTYEFWVVGHNAQSDGSESNHVTHVAT
jgi:hypothetical protein